MSGKPMRHCYEASFIVKFLGELDHAEKFLRGAMPSLPTSARHEWRKCLE